jgi:hypothetical protein
MRFGTPARRFVIFASFPNQSTPVITQFSTGSAVGALTRLGIAATMIFRHASRSVRNLELPIRRARRLILTSITKTDKKSILFRCIRKDYDGGMHLGETARC